MAAIYNNDSKIASDSNTFSLDNIQQEIDDQKLTANVERFEGMDTIWTYESEIETELKIDYLLCVYNGKAKLVLITPDNEVTTLAEADSETQEPVESKIQIQSGVNRIKIVADRDTKFDIALSVPDGELRKIGF